MLRNEADCFAIEARYSLCRHLRRTPLPFFKKFFLPFEKNLSDDKNANLVSGAGGFHLVVGAFEDAAFFSSEAVDAVLGDFFEDGVDFFGDEGFGVDGFVFFSFIFVDFGSSAEFYSG